ncbi:MAG: aminodeoxychorismate synthase component I [Bacteroidota bacterium]
MLSKSAAISKLNELGATSKPFSFYSDFLGERWCIETNNATSSFQLHILNRISENPLTVNNQKVTFVKDPIPFEVFRAAFDQVVHEINLGNSFLTNLTFRTPIKTNLSLEEIFQISKAKYKLLVPNKFVVFSPESFIQIRENRIHSFPMKGTIDANIPSAEKLILNDPKEKAEHITIVDLIRNDLSRVADKVEVPRFRYIDTLETNDKNLLQVSSEIRGEMHKNWRANIGTILSKLAPAGSISGAPKPETLQIIQRVENQDRGFYTGICGHFDGDSLDTGVMIRFIKKEGDRLTFCSGGGITSFSEVEKEYQEMVDKVYLAV